MSQDLEYLEKEIKHMKCDMEKPFAFISYSHDDHDARIVMDVYKRLMEKGYNLWIDKANMPLDENNWNKSAIAAMRNENCRMAFFFRSESSMCKSTIAEEVTTIKILDHIKPFVVVDIWHSEGMNAEKYRKEIYNNKEVNDEDMASFMEISKRVNTGCNAIRFAEDAGNDILRLADRMETELEQMKGTSDDNGSDTKPDQDENGENNDDELKSKFADGYHYFIYDKEYKAGHREQANLMYDTFKALTDVHPEKVSDIAGKCTSVSKKSEVLSPGTREAKPPYFRICKGYPVSGIDYLVGSSYGFEPKIDQIYKMIDACGEDRSVFRLEGYEQKKKRGQEDKTTTNGEGESCAGGFEYTLWELPHTAKKLSDIMHDVFELIAKKYPNKIADIAASESVSSVARKEDVDGDKLAPGKKSYFRTMREHKVEGTAYYVGTSYNSAQGIGQLERMLKICEGNADGFRVIKYPEKSSRSGGKKGKQTLRDGGLI